MSSTQSTLPQPAWSSERLQLGLGLLGGDTHPFLRDAAQLGASFSFSGDRLAVLCDGSALLDDYSLIEQAIARDLTTGPRLLLPRLRNVNSTTRPDPRQCLGAALDNGRSLINAGLETPAEVEPASASQRAPGHWARTLLLLGAPLLAALDLNQLPSSFDRLVVLETNPRDLALALSLVDLAALASQAKQKGMGLQLVFDRDTAVLQQRLREQFVGLQPTALHGVAMLRSPIDSPSLKLIETWLRSPEGLTQAVAGGLGGEVDELNQLLEATVTACQVPSRPLLAPQADREQQPVVLVASGPSLDEALPWLQHHQNDLQIVASGSSLGVLMRNGIRPAAAVFLERSSTVHDTDLMELIQEGVDLSGVPLMGSMTLDPRIHHHFGPVAWFHRPLSTTLALFPDEAPSKLLQSGPQSANAALEALLHLGHRRVLLIGCDFSAAKRSKPRAEQALGVSPRRLDLPLPGRHGRTVFSNPELADASYYFTNALRVYSAKVTSIAAGVRFEGVDLDLVDLDDAVAREFLNTTPLTDGWDQLPTGSVPADVLIDRLHQALKAYDAQSERIRQAIASAECWSLELARDLDQVLKLDETNLTPSQALVKRLCHYPLLMLIQPLHDATHEEWPECKRMALENLSWLETIYSTYFQFLIQQVSQFQAVPKQAFSWDAMRAQMQEA